MGLYIGFSKWDGCVLIKAEMREPVKEERKRE